MSGSIRRSSLEIEEVKCDEHTVTSAEKQIKKDWTARIVNERNLAVQNSAVNPKVTGDPLAERSNASPSFLDWKPRMLAHLACLVDMPPLVRDHHLDERAQTPLDRP